jgi:hypothetical protein
MSDTPAPLPSTETTGSFEEITSRMDTMKGEIDGLQIGLTSQKKPWYRDLSTLISFLALLFSFGTTFVSYRRRKCKMWRQPVRNCAAYCRD